ncbi:MAG TPA: sensor domain-containing protein [Gammaproteobacteria bacterium]|nr:sensor domain-containing protein [Gammaproteobacteria bacterium]
MTKPVPRSVQEYLDQLRQEFAGEDPALAQDALYDAEEYLRGELHQHPDRTEEQVLAAIATTYGAPEEVAEAYRATEAKVQLALRTPRPKKRRTVIGRFFSVMSDPRAYSSLFYMLLAMFTGIFYFTWAVAGTALSAGLLVLIIGLPFLLLFLGSTRLLSLVEGRIVETLLGVRMPRRPVHPGASRPFWERVKEVFTDHRTWTTLLYMVLQMPLGVIYFTLAVSLGSTALALIFSPIGRLFDNGLWITLDDATVYTVPWILTPFASALGVVLLVGLMHAAKGIGYVHGHIAKTLLVQSD